MNENRLRPCPVCGTAPELIEEPVTAWGMTFEGKFFSYRCPKCRKEIRDGRSGYFADGSYRSEDEAKEEALSYWDKQQAPRPPIDWSIWRK